MFLGEAYSQGSKPTEGFCKSYAEQTNFPPEKILIDYGEKYGSFEGLWSVLYSYSAFSLALPWVGILDGDDMEYLYSSGAPEEKNAYVDMNEALNAALSD